LVSVADSSWVDKFVSERGVEELMAALQTPGGTTTETYSEVLSTLFVLSNHCSGFPAILDVPEWCPLLWSAFDSSCSSNEIRARMLKLLGKLCSDSAMASDAVLTDLSPSKTPEKRSVQALVAKLEQNQSDVTLLLAAVIFFNAVLQTSRDKKLRRSFCEDLKTSGFLTLLDPFKSHTAAVQGDSSPTESMASQVEMFFDHFGEVTKEDKFGALRLALGGALTTNPVRSDQGGLMRDLQAENQQESGQVVNPEQEHAGPESTAHESICSTGTPKPEDAAAADNMPANSSLGHIFSQLHSHTKKLDPVTNDKLVSLLQKLALTLSDESGATQAVDQLERSFSTAQNPGEAHVHDGANTRNPEHVEAKPPQEPDLLTRVGLALFPGLSEPASSVTKPPTSGRPTFFSGLSDFSLPSLSANTPAKSSVSRPSFSSFIGADSAASPWGRSTDSSASRAVKLSLPFFQSSRKGPGLGATPACTPIATASVRKDAKRPVFPSFPSPPRKEVSSALPPPAPALPQIDIRAVQEAVKPLMIDPEITTDPPKAAQPPTTGTDISKFRKLLSMGAPREAVRAKMQQAGVDPDLLDEQQGFTPTASPKLALSIEQAIPKEAAAAAGADITKFRKLLSMGAPLDAVKAKMRQAGLDPVLLDQNASPQVEASTSPLEISTGPDISKFKKLLSMGAPLAAVKAKMTQAGLDPALLDGPAPATSSASSAPSATTKVKEDPSYAKFFKLLSMGAPAAAVKAKMLQAGLNSDLLDTPDADMPATTPAAESQVKVKEDPQYAKFFKLLSMGAPAESVKAKMQMAGLKPELLDTPDAEVPNANAPVATATPAVKVKDDPAYAKFFKLLSMGAPAESVKAKMQMAGLKPELLDTPDAEIPSGDTKAAAQPQVKVKDDPAYAKFFKLLAMGAPPESVKAKMRMAGLQADLLDTPDAPLAGSAPSQPAAAAPVNNAARRAHLSIAIKPVVKAKTRSFYWQHLKAEAIKGTIWEELEKEHSSQSNQDLLTLSESELGLLETEFPPPAACGPSTGTRRGSMSGIGSPGPTSPLASPRIVFLIDRARSNNISIIVKQFRMSNATLRVAIMKMDADVLTLDRVQGLIKILPTEEEIAAITGFNGDPTTLNGAELVLKELITVPRLKQRLSALETKHQFPALVRDLQTKINKIRVASVEIAQSSDLKTILLVILQVGNKMNDGTARGGAKGFRLVDLTKLVQLKSVDRSVTLLHYVARMIRMKKGNVVRLGDSLASLYDVQSIPIPELQGDMNRINDMTENINVELAAQRLKNRIEEKEESDLFVEAMTAFVDDAGKEVTTLKKDLDETLRLMRDTMLRFDRHTDDDDAPPPAADAPLTPAALTGAGEFFSIIYEFTMSLMKADRENELKRVRDEKRLKQQELKNATPRRNSVDRPALTKLNSNVAGPETQETQRRKSMIAVPSSAAFRSEGVSKLLSGVPNNPVTATADETAKPGSEPESGAVQPLSKPGEASPAIADATTEEKAALKPSGTPKTALKVPGEIIKAAARASAASPLKKVVGTMPTGIPSPMKLKRMDASSAAPTASAAPFDAASLNEIKAQLKSKHATNNEPQVRRGLKPEVEADSDDHDNNNSEPSSPEKTLSEAEPSTRVAVQSDV
jgi:hypothetical protein